MMGFLPSLFRCWVLRFRCWEGIFSEDFAEDFNGRGFAVPIKDPNRTDEGVAPGRVARGGEAIGGVFGEPLSPVDVGHCKNPWREGLPFG